MACGASLSAPAPSAEERKVVTTLFCDLVAFTAMSEIADPEDVDAVLRRYHAAARKVIESHGGTVEKFIGDAVVGVFGVPAAHEDDPERAVRAGLRIVQALEGMTRPDGSPLQIRIGVNTGEALVRLDVTPGSGEGFLTGDAVNTAARLQAAAPPGGVVVGATTHALSSRTIVYEQLPPVIAKGKAEPVPAWLAVAPVARTGSDPSRLNSASLVGRDSELAYVCDVFARVIASSLPQLTVVVGEPGIGKSRLVAELAAYAEASPTLVTWRQGRCLPYGEGVAFLPLAEIVKAHAGILESDDRATLADKLEQVLPESPDRPWFRNRLLALLGESAPEAARGENFAAWSQFLELVAEREPLVLVFEDLHWADEALLAFVEQLVDAAADVPLLVVATARPELFDAHPEFAAAVRSAGRVNLAPLRANDMERLVEELLGARDVPADVPAAILAGAAGNPYFAEESARLFRDRGSLGRLPDTVQALIAARLDALNPDAKAVLSDAAVIGLTFWAGAAEAVGGHEPGDIAGILRELAAKQFIHRSRTSTMAGESELTFWHALARDVAYQQLPRAARARKHAAAAAWLERVAGERAEELAEIIAHHYVSAHELAVAAGDEAVASETLDPALDYLVKAGRRALLFDPTAAKRHFGKARDLAPAIHPRWPRIQLGWAGVCALDFRMREADVLLEEIIPALKASGDTRGAAEAMERQVACRVYTGGDISGLSDAAVALLEAGGPSRDLVEALSSQALWSYLGPAGDLERTVSLCERAIEMAGDLGMPPPVGALSCRAMSHIELGREDALGEYEAAIAESRSQGLKGDTALLLYNYCTSVLAVKGARQALTAVDEGLGFSRDADMAYYVAPFRMLRVEMLIHVGEWEVALAEADGLAPILMAADARQDLLEMRCWLIALLERCGETERARALADEITAEAKRIVPVPYVRTLARHAAVIGHSPRSAPSAVWAALTDWANEPPTVGEPSYVLLVPDVVRATIAHGDLGLAEAACDNVRPTLPHYRHAIASGRAVVAEARGEHKAAAAGFADAATGWHKLAIPYEEGQALLGQGRCLVALGRAPEAAAPLAAAREIFARLGAKPALKETDAVLAGSQEWSGGAA